MGCSTTSVHIGAIQQAALEEALLDAEYDSDSAGSADSDSCTLALFQPRAADMGPLLPLAFQVRRPPSAMA